MDMMIRAKTLSTITTTLAAAAANAAQINSNGKRHVAGICSGIFRMKISNAILMPSLMISSFDHHWVCCRHYYCNFSNWKNRSLQIRSFTTDRKKSTTKKMSDEQSKAQQSTDDGKETIFGMMLAGKIPVKFIYEDDMCVAFDDINPVAPVHFLVIPRKPITQLSKSTDDDQMILGRMMCVARKVAEQKGLAENGYRLVMNNGRHGCQSVYHIHIHVIGGRQLGWPPC
ncbi:hypothetical protein DERP_004124 [Dermatophagoides pteronyssinus]|uniref:HIT domain-containing protein n=1 Tax=Dermatophagoides pteronyssinus TaxID=6956 RepID=A0ABQ8J899_DERPT|nr:hypothetical protein DERP_004124 [Dermatophagoides pteronyssinus]